MKELHKAITEIDVLSPPKEYVGKILQAICDHLGYCFASVIEVDEQGKGRLFVAYNEPEGYIEKVHGVNAPILSSPSGEAIETGKVVVVRDLLSEPRLKPWYELVRLYNIQTNIWVPLLGKERAFGAYVLYDTQTRDVSEEEIRMLEQIGVMVSIAITSNRYLNQLNRKTEELGDEITERKKAEESLRIKDNALESSINAIAIADIEGNLTYVNKSFLKMWGYDDDKEVLGKLAVDFWQIKDEAEKTRKILLDKGGWMGELTAKKKDGSLFDVQLSATLVKDETDEPPSIMASFVDITERKRAEEALKKKNEELERFNKLAVGRELRMIELKREINALFEQLGKEPGYKIAGES